LCRETRHKIRRDLSKLAASAVTAETGLVISGFRQGRRSGFRHALAPLVGLPTNCCTENKSHQRQLTEIFTTD
jgi:hypothetical protein